MCVCFLFSRKIKLILIFNSRVKIHKHGGNVLPTFDPATATHIVTETSQQMTLRALGLKSLSEIPHAIPTVKWGWVISGRPIPGEKDKRQMDYEFMHAAFPSRMDAGRTFTADKDTGKQKAVDTGAQQELDDAAYVASLFRDTMYMLIEVTKCAS
jgi:hypothetical protein